MLTNLLATQVLDLTALLHLSEQGFEEADEAFSTAFDKLRNELDQLPPAERVERLTQAVIAWQRSTQPIDFDAAVYRSALYAGIIRGPHEYERAGRRPF